MFQLTQITNYNYIILLFLMQVFKSVVILRRFVILDTSMYITFKK